MIENFHSKVESVTRHASVTCDRFERRFAALGHDWTCIYEEGLFYVSDGDVHVGSASAENIVREGIDALVNQMIAAQEGPLPFERDPEDEEYDG